MALFIKTMSIVLPYTIIIWKYLIFIFKSDAIMELYYRIQENWKIIQNKFESEILWEQIRQCHLYGTLATSFVGLALIVAVIIQLLPVILDVIIPLDQLRPRKTIITAEYFVSEDNYFYAKILHEIIIISICGVIMLTTSIQLLIFTYHCYGIFKIASYRVQHSIEDSLLRMPTYEQKRAFCRRIMHVAIAHRKAMEFSDALVSPFNVPYCIMVITGVLSLSFNLYRFVDAVTVSKNMEDMMISYLVCLCHIIYMYVGNYLGQMISDYNHDIFKSLYTTSWYLLPASSQKLISFLMQKTGKDFTFTIGFLFTAKIESFAMLANTAMSYVTVMLSTQRKSDDR